MCISLHIFLKCGKIRKKIKVLCVFFFLHDKITTFCFEIIYFKYNLNEDNLDHAITISYYIHCHPPPKRQFSYSALFFSFLRSTYYFSHDI